MLILAEPDFGSADVRLQGPVNILVLLAVGDPGLSSWMYCL